MKRFADKRVAALFRSYPPAVRAKLLALRELVIDVAARTPGVGPLTETLKWGQPSYLTEETGAGTTVRLGRLKTSEGCALYFHCQSGLSGDFAISTGTPSVTRASAPCCSGPGSDCP